MPAPVAAQTRSPFRASTQISAGPGGGPSPAATTSAPGSPRSTARRTGLAVGPRTAGRHGRGTLPEVLPGCILAGPGDGGQPPGGGAGPAHGIQFPGEGLDAGAADSGQRHGPGAAPAGELAQVQGVHLAGQAAIPGQRDSSGPGDDGLDRGEHGS